MDVSQLNASIRDIVMPMRIRRLPINERGYPVPFFVRMVNGKYDFRVIDEKKMFACVKQRLCWLCGEKLGTYMAFTIGPMCSVNRINSEPPSHLECAIYAVTACPFLSNPRMRRNEVNLPDGDIAGEHISHNPGAVAVWVTKSYEPMQVSNGVLFKLGEPTNVMWYAEGRVATRHEVLEAMHKGLPKLQEHCITIADRNALNAAVVKAMHLLPKEGRSHAGSIRQRKYDRQSLPSGSEDAADDRTTDTG